ncbi:MAG: NADH-quinone oxidoreductase subunit NuoG [Acidimicrobiia bacterium]|nr:NADH-quinone oxidoreductase subunit NuoG [Acidimicrobiia bacterium]
MPELPPPELVNITIDGESVQVPSGEMIIKSAEDNGTYIPRFCYHPRMKPVGMCRMCLVEVETPRGRMLTTACNFPAADELIVDTQSDVVQKAQEGILEFLLINHPLDCPVCDKGGECPLQDQTMAYGPGESRFVEEKRHFEKPIPLSELVFMDRERCILCARCTRFSEEVSGDPLIEFVDRGYNTQVITFPDEPFASYFSGNTVQICPVGALTAKPYRFKARPWDLEAVESVSMVDASGASVSVETSHNQVVRINGIDNDKTNHGWLSDKDRFIFQAIHSDERLMTPLIRDDKGVLQPASWGEALDLVADQLGSVRGDEVAAIGGANSTNEEAFSLSKFLRTVVVTPHVDAQVGDAVKPELLVGLPNRAEIDDLDRADTILLWAGDLKEEFPSLYLRVRNAVTELGAKLVVVHPRRSGLDDVASATVRYRPGDGGDLLRKLASNDEKHAVARNLLGDGKVVAVIGLPGRTEDPGLPEAVAAYVNSLPGARILPLARRGNVFGALDMGLAPTLLPGRAQVNNDEARAELEGHWGPLPEHAGHDTLGILAALAAGDLKALLLVGADPVRDGRDPREARQALRSADFVVSFDLFLNDSNQYAAVILPVDGFAETEGTVTNAEGRVQKVNRIVPGPGQSRALWSVLDELSVRMGGQLGAGDAAAIAKEIAMVAPAYRSFNWDRVEWGPERDGVVMPDGDGVQPLQYMPTDPGLKSAGGRLTLHFGRVLYDGGTRIAHSPALAVLAPEPAVHLHPRDASAMALTDGEIVDVVGDEASLHLPLRIDPTMAEGAAYIPANLDSTWVFGATQVVEIQSADGAGS